MISSPSRWIGSRFHGAQPGQGVGELALAVSRDAGQAEDLAGADGQVEAVEREVAAVAADAKRLHGEDLLPGRAGQLVPGKDDLPAGHQGRELRGRLAGRAAAEGHGALAEDGDPVGEGLHLVQLVADEDDRQLRHHPLQAVEEVVGLLRGQGRGGLVQDEQPRAQAEGLHQLHPLLLPHRELPDRGVGVHRQLVVGRDLDDPPPRLREVEPHPPLERLHAERDVLGHRHAGNQHEVLVHHADAQVEGVGGGAEVHRLAVHQDASLVGLVEPGEDVHEGRLPGAVLAHQGQHLAPADLEETRSQASTPGKRLVIPSSLSSCIGPRTCLRT